MIEQIQEEKTEEHNKLIIEYARLAVEKLKIGDGHETINSDRASDINQRMSEIRFELKIQHTTILSKAISLIK